MSAVLLWGRQVPPPPARASPHSRSMCGSMLGPIQDSSLIGPGCSLGIRIFRSSE